jgi:hypothetical protein
MIELSSIRNALHLAPVVVEHVVSLIGSKAGTGDDRVDGSKSPPVPFNEQAFNDANEIYQRLVYWAVFVAGKLGVQAPGPAVRAWRAADGTVVGLPAGIEPAGARYVTGVMASWLVLHLSEAQACMVREDVEYFGDELRDVYRVNARWPSAPRSKYSAMPCPDDGGRVAVFPPVTFGVDELRQCETCLRVFDEATYMTAFDRFLVGERERATAAKVVAHIQRKYLKRA